MNGKRIVVAFAMAIPWIGDVPTRPSRAEAPRHTVTRWRIEPSFKYDALCVLNTLTGDPYYLTHYQKTYDALSPRLNDEARAALANLKRILKDERQRIISAWLCYVFSVVESESLDQLLSMATDPSSFKESLQKSGAVSAEEWQEQFIPVARELATILSWMKTIDFESYWRAEAMPQAGKSIAEIQKKIDRYNVIPLVEEYLGAPLASNEIVVYVLVYTKPHGIRITGNRFITDADWPFKITARTAGHELMHPPFKWNEDAELRSAMETLREDTFLMEKVDHHNPSFGYNSFEGFVDEDCVQALDQLINERLGLADDPAIRWRRSDDGMHVLAVALYQLMKEDGYNARGELFRDYLIRTVRSGRLKPGRIKERYQAMYKADTKTEGSSASP